MINIDLEWLARHFNKVLIRHGDLIGVIESEVTVTGKSHIDGTRCEIVLMSGLTDDIRIKHTINECRIISDSEDVSLSGHIYVASYRIDKLRVGRRKAENDPAEFARQCAAERKESETVLATWGETRSVTYANAVFGVAAIFVAAKD